ncbi:MAG: class I SAM-dependent methyltransferase [Candidatus Paceibacterota bacterium]|jgi:23S rRNA (cytosine1962-C5)-methyltransferase
MKTSNILITESVSDYELLDSGESEKLERFGKFILSRPDPQALWHKRLPLAEWKKADGSFIRSDSRGDWFLKSTITDRWSVDFGGLKFYIKPTAFKHVGLFPEQSLNWEWLKKQIKLRNAEDTEVLNLFGYTGGATLACAQAGAKVVHVDGSKSAIAWARENAELSGIADKPVRWILDDARTFVGREIKRERKYDGIIMDPPAFGHGPENELWKIEEHFLQLVDDCFKILKDKPQFFLINGYSAGYSAIAYENILLPLVEKFGGKIEIGELAIQEGGNGATKQGEGRVLPCGIYARWEYGG